MAKRKGVKREDEKVKARILLALINNLPEILRAIASIIASIATLIWLLR